MKSTTSTVFVGAFALAAVLTGCATSEDQSAEAPSEKGEAAEDVSAEYNEADVEYVSGMIVHHQQAFEMSGMLLEKDDIEPEVETLAEDIREAQGPEIEQMESWLQSWGEDDGSTDAGGMENMDHGGMGGDDMGDDDMMEHEGMMSEEDLAQLEESTGTEASRMFLEQMIVHHEGAVSSAEQHLQEGENPEALELSENIIEDQQAEIQQMEEILTDL